MGVSKVIGRDAFIIGLTGGEVGQKRTHLPRYGDHLEESPWAASHIRQRMRPAQPMWRPWLVHSVSPISEGKEEVRVDNVR